MYDCSGPTLVFVTQTHHPVLEHHTGYLFALFDIHYHKPKELFFQHIAEAQVFALYRGARLCMSPDATPERVTAVEYALNGEDESRFIHMPELRGGSSIPPHIRRMRKLEKELRDAAEREEELDLQPDEPTGMMAAIDFFGDDP